MPSFARDIRVLFRENDVDEMKFAFDLSDYEDVKRNAQGIYDRLADGSMPCDGAWPADWLQRFQQWIADGCPE